MTSRFDSHLIAQLLTGRDVNGQRDAVSPPYRGLVDDLAGLSPEERLGRFHAFLEGRDDKDQIIMSVAAADPDGPPPAAGEDDPVSGWGPLRLGELPPPESFPLGALPDPMCRVVGEISAALGVDPGVGGGICLGLAGASIGRSASLLVEPNRFAPAIIFHATLAPPGTAKSPFLEYLRAALDEIERELGDAFAADKALFLAARKADKTGGPPPPVPRRLVIENTTCEALSRVLSVNQRGVAGIYDEYGVLLNGLNQYKGGRGADRGAVLKYWNGDSTTVDRVTNEFGEPLRVRHPHLCLVGNMTPSGLATQFGREDDGLLDRWIFSAPGRPRKLKSAERGFVTNEALAGWNELVRRLWARPMDQSDGRAVPHVVYFSNAGKAEYNRFYDAHVDEVNDPNFSEHLHGPWAKLEEYFRRFILILALAKHAADPTADPTGLPLADVSIVRDAWRLCAYFKNQHRRVRAMQERGGGSMPDGAKWVFNWVRAHPDRETVSGRDLTQVYPPSRGFSRAALEDGLGWLVRRNALRPGKAPDRPKGSPGRPPTATWEIHPEFQKAQQNQQNQQNTPESESGGGSNGHFADSAGIAALPEGEE